MAGFRIARSTRCRWALWVALLVCGIGGIAVGQAPPSGPAVYGPSNSGPSGYGPATAAPSPAGPALNATGGGQFPYATGPGAVPPGTPAETVAVPGAMPTVAEPPTALPSAEILTAPPRLAPGQMLVVNVAVQGYRAKPVGTLPALKTRVGEAYDPRAVEDDVKQLIKSRRFVDVRPQVQQVQGGVSVIFQVVQRPTIKEVKIVGNQTDLSYQLLNKISLKVGDGLDPYSIKEARDKLETYYREHGCTYAKVTVAEGINPGDSRVVFLVDEGPEQKVARTKFVGNTISSAGRLRTVIQTGPPILYLVNGYVDRKKIDEDVERLTAYYRALGFFQCKIGRELEFNDKETWLTVTFVVNEGPRFTIRNITFIGPQKVNAEVWNSKLKLHANEFFNQSAMNKDLAAIRDAYGSRGYVFADVQADPRFLEQPGTLDLVYNIKEGNRYRVGKINVNITGDDTHTSSRVVWNRLQLRPGDILDTTRLRSDERPSGASSVFDTKPNKAPKIVFAPPPDLEDAGKGLASKPGMFNSRPAGSSGNTSNPYGSSGTTPSTPGQTYRGQAPDADDDDRYFDMTVTATLARPDDRQTASQLDSEMARPLPPLPEPRDIDELPEMEDAAQPAAEQSRAAPALPYGAVIRGQAPDGPFNAIIVRAQAPVGGAPVYGTDPDSAPPVRPVYNPYPQPAQPTASNIAPAGSANPTFRQAQFQTAPAQAGVLPPPGYPAQPQPGNAYPPGYVAPPPGYVQPQPGFSAPPQNGPAQPSYLGPPGGAPQVVNPYPPTGPMQNFVYVDPQLGVDVNAAETQTGKLSLGVGINSDAGLVGNVVIDEQNFDISRWPESWEDIREGQAWRGAGQRLRVDVSPGVNVQNYSLSFQEPYLANTPVSFSERANYFQRIYDFWNESRTGNRVGLGYYFTPDLSGAIGIRTEEIRVYNPTVPTPLELEEALGHNFAYGIYETVSHDTRDSPFLPSAGHLFQVNLEQNWGDWHYPVETVDYRQYWTLAERADGSGKNTLGAGLKVGFSGPDTPIYDHFYAGGYSTLRGFYFRGASPLQTAAGSSTQVQVGGDFEFLGTVEYLFPITPDDVIRGTFFVDYGTVESNVEMNWQDFRISPGFGLRIAIPQFGSAPIALDFAFPVHKMPGDKLEFFSFWVGVNR